MTSNPCSLWPQNQPILYSSLPSQTTMSGNRFHHATNWQSLPKCPKITPVKTLALAIYICIQIFFSIQEIPALPFVASENMNVTKEIKSKSLLRVNTIYVVACRHAAHCLMTLNYLMQSFDFKKIMRRKNGTLISNGTHSIISTKIDYLTISVTTLQPYLFLSKTISSFHHDDPNCMGTQIFLLHAVVY